MEKVHECKYFEVTWSERRGVLYSSEEAGAGRMEWVEKRVICDERSGSERKDL